LPKFIINNRNFFGVVISIILIIEIIALIIFIANSLISQIGQKNILSQGQVVEIGKSGDNAIKQILVGVNWEKNEEGENMDVDLSGVLLPLDNSFYDLIYYGDKEHSSGCVIHRGDNLVGGKMDGNASGDSENMDIYIPKVPDTCDKLIFVLTKKHTFSAFNQFIERSSMTLLSVNFVLVNAVFN